MRETHTRRKEVMSRERCGQRHTPGVEGEIGRDGHGRDGHTTRGRHGHERDGHSTR